MASILTCLVTSAAWCCCTASASLLSSCCGNDKGSDIPPSATSGRRRSVFLLILTLALAFTFQYGVGPYIHSISIGNYVQKAWTDGCLDFATEDLAERCVGNNGVFRATASALVFYVLAAIAAACKPTANREAWPAKFVLFLFMVLVTCFIPNDPIFSGIYLQIARIGGILFILAQQVVILDLAFNWNDSWVEKSNAAELEEVGSGKKWLAAILVSCFVLFTLSLVGIGLMFAYFNGCGTNEAFIAITLVMGIAVTAAQMSGEESSLLGSGVIVAYTTNLCYNAVGKNPNEQCNPFLGKQDVLGIILGVGMTLISLGWTGWSYTAEDKIGGKKTVKENLIEEPAPKKEGNGRHVAGVVTGVQDYGSNGDEEEAKNDTNGADVPATGLTNSWKLNLVLGILSCWVAMALTSWGGIQTGGNVANPDVGRVSMWMIIASQWIVLLLYLWSLVAPRLFPDRDFA